MPNEDTDPTLEEPMNLESRELQRQGERWVRSEDAEEEVGLESPQLKRRRTA